MLIITLHAFLVDFNMKQFALSKDILLRKECFGGLVINRKKFMQMEINHAEYEFLCNLEKCAGYIKPTVLLAKNKTNKNINYKKFLREGVIEESHLESLKLDDFANSLSAPLEMAIYPTLKCNMSCKFCFVKNKNVKEYNEIPVAYWIDAIEQAKDMGVFSISILGGEPTLYSDIIPLLEAANESGLNITITSNGMNLSKDILNTIIGLEHVIPVFSIQDIGEKNKYLMGGDYRSTLNSVEYLLERNKRVRLNSVYTNQSIGDFTRIIDYCITHGIDRYSIGLYMDINESNNGIERHSFYDGRILDEQLKEYIVEKYGKNKLEVSLEGCMLYTGYPEYENDIYHISQFEKIYYGCRAGRTKLEIYSNGDVYPCICYENVIQPVSNIVKEKLSDIWKNDTYMKELRAYTTINKECKKCGYNIICNGGCPALRKQLHGASFAEKKDPRCKVHMEER